MVRGQSTAAWAPALIDAGLSWTRERGCGRGSIWKVTVTAAIGGWTGLRCSWRSWQTTSATSRRSAWRLRGQRAAARGLAEVELNQVIRDRSSIEAAEAELARVESDPGLLGAIADAREHLNRCRADIPELIEARRRVLELARQMVKAPEPLRGTAPTA